MKCVKCGRLTSSEVEHCVYCGNEQVISAGTPMNVNVPLMGEGPGRLLVTFKQPEDATPSPDETWDYDKVSQSPVADRERRVVVVRVPDNLVFDFFAFGMTRDLPQYVRFPELNLPPGCRLVGRPSHDFVSGCFLFLVEHESFAPVPNGMYAPDYPGVAELKYRAVKITKDE